MNGQALHWSDLPLMLTTAEAAQVLRVKPRAITNMLCDGRLKGVKISNKNWRITRAELMRFVGEDGELMNAAQPAEVREATTTTEANPWEHGDLLKLAGIAAGGPPDLSSDKYKYFGEIYGHDAWRLR